MGFRLLQSSYSRVVKARHLYDMNVVKDQNKHIKDKYCSNILSSGSSVGSSSTLESVRDMLAESFSVYIVMSSLSLVKTSFNCAKDIQSVIRQ